MSVAKVPKSEKVREELTALKAKDSSNETTLNHISLDILNSQRDAATAYAQMLDAKKRYRQSILDQRIFTSRKMDLVHNQATILREIEMKDIELSVVIQEEADKEKTKYVKANKIEPILEKINKLPEDIVRIIGEYVPYSVRIELLESRQKTSTLLNKMTCDMSHMFLGIICTEPDFLKMLSPEEAMKQMPLIYDEYGEIVRNLNYSPFYGRNYKHAQYNYRIRHILNLAKEVNPKFVYKIMKMIRILFNPLKKYIIKYTSTIPRRANALIHLNLNLNL